MDGSSGTRPVISTIGSAAGDISLDAGGNYHQTATTIIASGGNIVMSGSKIDIDVAHGTFMY